MMINAAQVSSTLFRKVFRHCDSGGDDLPSHSTSTAASGYAFLRLDSSPSAKEVGTTLCLIPTIHHENAADAENENNVNSDTETINIHPLLLKVLVRSSNLVKQYCPTTTEIESNNEADANLPVASKKYPVLLSSYDYFPHGEKGWLEEVNVKDINKITGKTGEGHASIHLTYICSNTSRGRRYYGSSSNTDGDAREQGMELLTQILVGEVIAEGGILGICLGKNDGMGTLLDTAYGEDEHQEIVFFMVDNISTQNGAGAEKNAKFIHLWSQDSYKVSLNLPKALKSRKSGNSARISRNTMKSNIQLDDVHHSCPGYEAILEELLTLAKLDNPNGAPTAVVLSGCSGVGKSRMASWFEQVLSRDLASSELAVWSSSVSAKDILLEEAASSFDLSKVLDESKSTECSYRLLIIDDLDAVVGNPDETGSSSMNYALESEQLRALNAIVKLLYGVTKAVPSRYFVLGISRASWAQLPLQLARVGRFEKAVAMSPPTLDQRRGIFKFWLSTLPLVESIDRDSTISQWADLLAPRTAGCVAADIRRICADALTSAVARLPRTSAVDYGVDGCAVNWEDIKEAARTCIPSQLSAMDVIPASLGDNLGNGKQGIDMKQEFELAWKNFGGYDAEKKRLYRTVVRPWKYHIMETVAVSNNLHADSQSASIEATLGISKPSGVLFHGPSGVGKTFAAMCLASSLGIHCVKVRASEVFNQWLGGSEATLRSIFSRARAASPCILFFDELDSLAMNREGGDSDATSGVQSRILTTLLNEMDGITNAGGKQGILVVAATNRLDAIDAALLRPGRLEEHVLLSFPKSSYIHDILMIHTAKMPLDSSVDLAQLSDMLEVAKASCAEIEGICRDACLIAMRRCSENGTLKNLSVLGSDFYDGFRRIKKNALSP